MSKTQAGSKPAKATRSKTADSKKAAKPATKQPRKTAAPTRAKKPATARKSKVAVDPAKPGGDWTAKTSRRRAEGIQEDMTDATTVSQVSGRKPKSKSAVDGLPGFFHGIQGVSTPAQASFSKLRSSDRMLLEFFWNHLPAIPANDVPSVLDVARGVELGWLLLSTIIRNSYLEITQSGISRLQEDRACWGGAEAGYISALYGSLTKSEARRVRKQFYAASRRDLAAAPRSLKGV